MLVRKNKIELKKTGESEKQGKIIYKTRGFEKFFHVTLNKIYRTSLNKFVRLIFALYQGGRL